MKLIFPCNKTWCPWKAFVKLRESSDAELSGDKTEHDKNYLLLWPFIKEWGFEEELKTIPYETFSTNSYLDIFSNLQLCDPVIEQEGKTTEKRPPLWSRSNIVASHLVRSGSIPDRVSFVRRGFSEFLP